MAGVPISPWHWFAEPQSYGTPGPEVPEVPAEVGNLYYWDTTGEEWVELEPWYWDGAAWSRLEEEDPILGWCRMVDLMLGDHETAQRTLRALSRMMRKELDQAGVNPRLATVTAIDVDAGTCRVKFRNEPNDIRVRMGATQPREIGQVVRVGGPSSDLWVIDVIGTAALTGAPSTLLTAPTNLVVVSLGPSLTVSWIGVAYADRYEVQFIDDTTSTVISVQTLATRLTVDDLIVGESYTVQVRAVTSADAVGPWVVSPSSITVDGYPAPAFTDGSAPASSPQPVVNGGIGSLYATWTAVPNTDLVTYEVYADIESGFTPSPTNKLGETTGTFWAFNKLASGAALPYDNFTFVRIIARDGDGVAPAGAQGFAAPSQVQSDDFGSVENLAISDGIPPSESPSDFNVTAGIGYLFLTWEGVTNGDEVTYEVHMSTSPTFVMNSNTLVAETKGTFVFLRERPPGFGGGPLTYETTYHIRIQAKDRDGLAPTASPIKTGTSVKAGNGDIGNGAVGTLQIESAAITQALIAEAAIGSAQIQEAAITTAKIIDGAISNAKIGLAAIGTANIADLAVGNAQIQDAAITDAKIATLNADKINAGTINGIDIFGSTITGSILRTATTGNRIEVSATTPEFVFYYSGSASEQFAGYVRAGVGTNPFSNVSGYLTIACPKVNATTPPLLELWHEEGTGDGFARFSSDVFEFKTDYLNVPTGNSWKFHIGATLERFAIAPTTSSLYFSTGNREFQWAADGNVVVYELSTPLWDAGTTLSDRRLKKNIQTIDPEARALDLVRAVDFVEYEYADHDMEGEPIDLPDGKRIGLSAQDLEAVFPQGVTTINGTKLIDTHSTLMLLVGAVKALDARVQALTPPGQP